MATKSRSVTEDQFGALFQALARDVVDAHIYWGQAKALRAQLLQWPDVYTEGFAFWSYSLQALERTAVSCLSRVFDQDSRALHLRSLLQLTKDHLHYFGKVAAARRHVTDPFARWLPDDAEAPDPAQLAEDLSLCELSNADVAALALYRNNFIAHRSTTLSMRGTPPTNALEHELIERLLDRSRTFLNRYSYRRDASIYSMTPLGHDAVEAIFKAVQSRLDTIREQREAEIERHAARVAEFESALEVINSTAAGREEEAQAERRALTERFGLSLTDAHDRFGVVIYRGANQPVRDEDPPAQ